MNLARSMERRIEHLVDGFAARVFKGRVHPVEIANRLMREADLQVTRGPAGPVVPNRYEVILHPDDIGDSTTEMEHRLAQVVDETAQERGWRLEGPPAVDIKADKQVHSGTIALRSEVRQAGLLAWANLIELEGGRRFPLYHNRELIGRSSRCDIVLGDDAVSRSHAVIWREGGSTWVTDIQSSNGTYVGSVPASEATELRPGDSIMFGAPLFTFRSA